MSAQAAANSAHVADNVGKIGITGGGTMIGKIPVGQINVGVPIYRSPDGIHSVGAGVSHGGILNSWNGPYTTNAIGASYTYRF